MQVERDFGELLQTLESLETPSAEHALLMQQLSQENHRLKEMLQLSEEREAELQQELSTMQEKLQGSVAPALQHVAQGLNRMGGPLHLTPKHT
jgi:hypothetical protein